MKLQYTEVSKYPLYFNIWQFILGVLTSWIEICKWSTVQVAVNLYNEARWSFQIQVIEQSPQLNVTQMIFTFQKQATPGATNLFFMWYTDLDCWGHFLLVSS